MTYNGPIPLYKLAVNVAIESYQWNALQKMLAE